MPSSNSSYLRRAVSASTMLVAVAFAGCSPDDGSGASSPFIEQVSAETMSTPSAASASTMRDPCALVSVEEISETTGLTSFGGSPSTSGGAAVCTWVDVEARAAVIQIYRTASAYEESRAAFESMYGGPAESVAGVGDRGFYIAGRTGPLPTGTISLAKGATVASVQVISMSGDADTLRGQTLALARLLAGKL